MYKIKFVFMIIPDNYLHDKLRQNLEKKTKPLKHTAKREINLKEEKIITLAPFSVCLPTLLFHPVMPTMSQSTDAEGKFKAVLIALKVSTLSLRLSEHFHCYISTLALIIPAQCDYELKSKHRTWAQSLFCSSKNPIQIRNPRVIIC